MLGKLSEAPPVVEPPARNGAHLVVQLWPADLPTAVAEAHEIDRLGGHGRRGGRARISQCCPLLLSRLLGALDRGSGRSGRVQLVCRGTPSRGASARPNIIGAGPDR